MFYFRINKVKIFKNGEVVPFWQKDTAEVELWSFLTTDDTQLPDMSDFLLIDNDRKRKNIVKDLVKTVVELRVIAPIERVKDNHVMTFGDTGYVLYQSNQIPKDINWQLLVIDLDEKERDEAKLAQTVLSDPGFDRFVDGLPGIVAGAATPTFTAAVAVGKFVTDVILKKLENNKDDLIGNLLMSLNRQEHYPHGERKKDDVPDLMNNIKVDYSIFGFDDR